MTSRTRNLGVAAHLKMAEAVTVLAERHKIADRSVLPVAIDMVQKNDFWMGVIATIGAFSVVRFPSIYFVGSRTLCRKRRSVPRDDSALIAAELSAGSCAGEAAHYIELSSAFRASALLAPFLVLMNARERAEVALPTVVFAVYKYLAALATSILHVGKSRAAGSGHSISYFHPSATPFIGALV